MNKAYIIIGASAVIILLIIFSFFLPDFVHIFNSENAVIRCDSLKIKTGLNSEDSEALRKIADNKWYFSDSPSCGFTEKLSFSFGNEVFMPACDKCELLCRSGKYAVISASERKTLEKIFRKYNITFPCY